MKLRLRLEYWRDGRWFVGRLPQVPGVFSQGAALDELEENVRDAYRMMLDEQESLPPGMSVLSKEIEVFGVKRTDFEATRSRSLRAQKPKLN